MSDHIRETGRISSFDTKGNKVLTEKTVNRGTSSDQVANINTLIAKINRGGFATTNRFSLVITGHGTKVSFLNDELGHDFAIQCESVGLPGMAFSTTDHKMHGGWNKKPYEGTIEDITAVFRLSPGLPEREKFIKWMGVIQDPSTGNFGYLDEYKSTIDIRHYDAGGGSSLNKQSYGVKLTDAFPISIAEMDYNMATQNEYAKLAVTFTYKSIIEL